MVASYKFYRAETISNKLTFAIGSEAGQQNIERYRYKVSPAHPPTSNDVSYATVRLTFFSTGFLGDKRLR